MQSETMIPDRELTRALQVCMTSNTCLLCKFQVADHVFVYYTYGCWELELHFHLTSHSRCPWASPLRGSWWRTPSPRRSSPATPSPSTRWASRFCHPCYRTLSQLRSRITNTQSFAGLHLAVPPSEDPAGKCQGWRGGAGEERDQEEGELLPLVTKMKSKGRLLFSSKNSDP